jgi:O-antigen ligase
LPVLWKEVSASPLWGKGFGTTVTYVTSDPRITLSTTDGKYTTYAFEWGWLDLWLKTGLIGVLGYLWLFYMLLSDCYRLMRRGDSRALAVGLSLSALGVLHFFTPYLNHPLGFSYLILAMLAVTFLRTQAITRS